MNPAFLLFFAMLALWPLGVASCVVLIGSTLLPKFRPHAWKGLAWGVLGATLPAAALFTLGKLMVGGTDLPGAEFMAAVGKAFFAGFAVAALIWYALYLRPALRKPSSNYRLERP